MTNFITITSGKGGVGKSVISANIANILASEGYKVGLFDADLGLANLDIILNVRSDKNLLNVMKQECSLAEIIVRVKKNLILIPGDSGDEILKYQDEFYSSHFKQEMEFLDDLDFMIIDTGAGIGDNIQPFLKASDEVIIVTLPNPVAITDAYATLKITSKYQDKVFMILNMVKDKEEGFLVFDNLKKVARNNIKTPLDIELLSCVQMSSNISKSVKLRTLFTDEYPNMIQTAQLREAVSNLLVSLSKKPIDHSSRGIMAFLKRLSEYV